MNPRRIIAVLAATLILFLPVTQWPDEVAAQTCVQHSIYNSTNGNSIVPWPENAVVHVSYDPNGHLGNGTGDAPPAWNLTNQGVSDFGTDWWNGLGQWNLYNSKVGGGDSSGIRYVQNTEGSTQYNWEVTTAWPSATYLYYDSTGQPHSSTITYSCPTNPCSTAAVTFYFPDVGAFSDSAAGALTMINTNGTYSVDGTSYNMWNASCEEASGCAGTNAANFSAALFSTAEHEAGHGENLGDVTTANSPASPCGDVMSQWSASSANPTGAVNNGGSCQTSLPNSCDVTEVKAGYNGSGYTGEFWMGTGQYAGQECETSNEPSISVGGDCITEYTTTYSECNGKQLPGYPVVVDEGTRCGGE